MGYQFQTVRGAREFFPLRALRDFLGAILAAIISLPCSCLAYVPAHLGSVTLSWNAVPGAESYNIYYGTASHNYDQTTSAATNQISINQLDPNATYFFAVTCIVGGLESGYSDEILFTPSPTPPVLQLTPSVGGSETLFGTAPSGHAYDVLASQDLAGWQAIGLINIGVDGSFHFVDPAAGQYPVRFYRLHETTYTAPASLPTLRLLPPPLGPGQVQITGQLGHRYDVLASQDLSVWNVIGTVTAGGQGMVTFTDAAGGRYPARFYMLHEVTYLSAAPVYTLALGPDGDLEVQISGLVGHTYEILGTPDFATWFSVGEVTIGMGGTGALTDPGSAGMFLFYTVQEVTGH